MVSSLGRIAWFIRKLDKLKLFNYFLICLFFHVHFLLLPPQNERLTTKIIHTLAFGECPDWCFNPKLSKRKKVLKNTQLTKTIKMLKL